MKQDRPGNTIITSVSLSKEFANIVKEYNISTTQALRKGIAIELYERGVAKYNSPLNRERLAFVNKFLEDLQKEADKVDLIKDLKINIDTLQKIIKIVEDK